MAAKARIDGAGLGCEPASAASLAGARKLRAEGVIAPGERVVCVLTGNLLKDPDAILARSPERALVEVDAEPAAVEPDIAPWLRQLGKTSLRPPPLPSAHDILEPHAP